MDRLSAYAAREAESETPEERLRKEEEASVRLLEKLSLAKEASNGAEAKAPDESQSPASSNDDDEVTLRDDDETTIAASEAPEDTEGDKEKEKESEDAESTTGKQARGIPEDVKLYEIFYEQVLNLVNVRAHTRSFGSGEGEADFHVSSKAQNLPVQDVTALLVSLANLALNIYPDRLGAGYLTTVSLVYLMLTELPVQNMLTRSLRKSQEAV